MKTCFTIPFCYLKHLFFLLLSTLLYFQPSYSQVTNPRTLPDEWGQYGIGAPYILKFRGKFYLYCSTRDDQNGVYYLNYSGNHVFSNGYRVNYATATTPLGTYTAGPDDPILLN